MPYRVNIEADEIARLLGKSLRKSQSLVQEIKNHNKKEKHQIITVEEFCKYVGIADVEGVRSQLK